MSTRNFFKYILLTLFLIGCSVSPLPVSQHRQAQLVHTLQKLDHTVPQQEAQLLSHDLFDKTAKLTKAFELTSPPWFHNVLVNVGLRKKGLCFHWADALYAYLVKKEYPHFAFHLAGANIGEYFFEHNVLVVTSKDGKFEEGIVIDPWRDSGKLYFSKLKEDKKYIWKHRVKREYIQK